MIDKDAKFQSLLLEKETPELNEKFEELMMLQIHQSANSRSKERKYIYLMYAFFVLGIFLGLILSFSLNNKVLSFGEYSFTVKSIYFQIFFIVVFLFIFEKVYKTILYLKGKEKIFEI